MKILFVGEAVSGFGGMETVIKNVIKYFNKNILHKPCNIFFFCRNDRMDKAWLAGLEAGYSIKKDKLSFLRNYRHVREIAAYVNQVAPDIIVAFDPLSCWLAARARNKTKINKKITLFSWVHFSLEHKKHAEKIIYADHHLAISTGIKEQITALGVDKDKVDVIFNPVSAGDFTFKRPASGDKAVFLYIGRLKFEGQKRVKDLLDSLSVVKGAWHLHVIGDGSDREKCILYARDKGLEKQITWHGWQSMPWAYAEKFIEEVSALLLTSAFEGLPMTLLEAMSHGIYCVSSDCPSGPKDIIIPGVNGQLYKPGELGTFTEILNGIIRDGISINAEQIKSSINEFYEEKYYSRFESLIYEVHAAQK